MTPKTESGALAKTDSDQPAGIQPLAEALAQALTVVNNQQRTSAATKLEEVDLPGEDAFDKTGWKRFRALKNAAPTYGDTVSKDGKHLFAPRFYEGKEILLPHNAQTARYVDLGYLEPLEPYQPIRQSPGKAPGGSSLSGRIASDYSS